MIIQVYANFHSTLSTDFDGWKADGHVLISHFCRKATSSPAKIIILSTTTTTLKYQINVHVRFIDKNSRLLNLRSLEVIGGHWRPLKVIGGRWRRLEATGGHWRSLEADGGQLRSFEAFNS